MNSPYCFGRGPRGLLLCRLLLIGALAPSLSSCSSGNTGLLTLTADGMVDQYDLYVRDEATRTMLVHTGWSDATKMGMRDLSTGALKIGIKLPSASTYSVVLIGVKGALESTPAGPRPAASATQYFFGVRQSFQGSVELSGKLLHVPAGDDQDRDLFPDATAWPMHVADAAALAPALLDCDDKMDYPQKRLKAADINPFAPEKCSNGFDEETCAAIDDSCPDSDNDGDPDETDCAKLDPKIHHPITDPTSPHYDPYPESPNCCGYNLGKTGADKLKTFAPPLCHPGTCGQGIDYDCDGIPVPCVNDQDCDGYAASAMQQNGCMAPANTTPPGNDCDDCDPTINPGAVPICDGKDHNCSGHPNDTCVTCDLDGDGFQRASRGGGDMCPDTAYKASGKPVDCNDEDRGIFPGSTSKDYPVRVPQLVQLGLASCNGKEGGTVACALRGFCRNRDFRGNPVDEDCDGAADEGCPPASCDGDGDGFIDQTKAATCDPMHKVNVYDCDDGDATVFPGAPENCHDVRVHNCGVPKAACAVDADNDGYDATVDCDDNNAMVHPFATELCNGIDDDCDGLVDEGNPDGTGKAMADASGVLRCTDSGVGQCAATVGDCVCSGLPIDKLHFETGLRTACPTETVDVDTGAAHLMPGARCYFAGQPAPEKCNGLDDDCDDNQATHTSDTTPGVAVDCPGPTPLPICCATTMSTSAACTNPLVDPNNCNGCGRACSSNNMATVTCGNGQCNGDCNNGFADCNTDKLADGCEINTNTDAANCGGCRMMCSPNHVPNVACGNAVCNGLCEAGWADCNGDKLLDGCEIHTDVDVANCGGCGNRCSPQHVVTVDCAGGTCDGACVAGFADCDFDKLTNGCEVDTTTDPNHCGGCGFPFVCSSRNMATILCGNSMCNGMCKSGFADCNNNKLIDGCEVDLNADPNNCSMCSTRCSPNHMATVTCGAGACNGTCAAGFGDCDNNKQTNGCEINTNIDAANCGGCRMACSPVNVTAACTVGNCTGTCNSGFANCDNSKRLNGCNVSTNTDPANCGGCTRACSPANITLACTGGNCTGNCKAGFADCDNDKRTNGCEVNTTNDPLHCGNCGTACPTINNTPTCVSSMCKLNCLPGFADCDGVLSNGCEVDLTSDTNHCGVCTTACSTVNGTPSCVNSICVMACNSGWGNCSGSPATGCETNINTTVNHCGGCGNKCSNMNIPVPLCTNGNCNGACASGFADCDNDKLTNGCEVNLNTDPLHCGACGAACSTANITAACSGMSCTGTCDAGFANCDNSKRANGCNVSIYTDVNHCGGCSIVCSGNNIVLRHCSMPGVCDGACVNGFADCNGTKQMNGCQTDLTQVANCGACGNNCSSSNSGHKCINMGCGCTGLGDCNPLTADGCNGLCTCGGAAACNPATRRCTPMGCLLASGQFCTMGSQCASLVCGANVCA